MDKYRRGLAEFRKVGTIVRRAGTQCWIIWDDDDIGEAHVYPEADIRYWIDSGRARLTGPERKTPLDHKVDPTA